MGSDRDTLVHMARLALTGQRHDVAALVRRTASRAAKTDPAFAGELRALLVATENSVVRGAMPIAIPTDAETRLHLVRREDALTGDPEPIWAAGPLEALKDVICEREKSAELMDAGLAPSRSMLFTGPPGVGKTLAARWLAGRLRVPLYVLDLAAVMSSYLGRTGNNLRTVLDFTRQQECVLLLDEFDAIAKRRDDSSEIGELKRLVTVLLQSIDRWPPTGLLIAATNHPDLLDPAVWRRFERVVAFPMPTRMELERYIRERLDISAEDGWIAALSVILDGTSFAEAERVITGIKRASVVHNEPVEGLVASLLHHRIETLPRRHRVDTATTLLGAGLSQRRVSEITGIARDTLRKHLSKK